MSRSLKTPFGDTTKAVIAHHFGRWTAYSALRSGKHVNVATGVSQTGPVRAERIPVGQSLSPDASPSCRGE